MKTISYVTCALIIAFFCVSNSEAQLSVPWDYQRYTATATASVFGGNTYEQVVTAYPPSSQLPITATADATVANATSVISASSMYVGVWVHDPYAIVGDGAALAGFWGAYIANSQFFQFSYVLSTNVIPPIVWLQVNDLTTSSNLFYESINNNTSDIIIVPTQAEHAIEVRINNELYNSSTFSKEATLNYNMSTATVVPEPISSILFVSGGAVLAGRRYLKRKKQA